MNTRRDFLKQAGVLSSALIFSPSFLLKERFKLGLQLYTIRDAMSSDVAGTLRKIYSFGYREVETYGFNKQYYGLDPVDFKKMLDDHNITTACGHYDLDKFILPGSGPDDLNRYVDDCIKGALALKQEFIVWPWLDPSLRSIEKFKVVADTLNSIGERVKKAGLYVAYHNHDFEFTDHNGERGYDIILQRTDPGLVKLELDLYWATYSNQDLDKLFASQPGRFMIWHIKDMDKNNRDLHTTVGDGTIDFKSILPKAKASGVKHLYVEQGNNYIPDSLTCVKRSAHYTAKELLK